MRDLLAPVAIIPRFSDAVAAASTVGWDVSPSSHLLEPLADLVWTTPTSTDDEAFRASAAIDDEGFSMSIPSGAAPGHYLSGRSGFVGIHPEILSCDFLECAVLVELSSPSLLGIEVR